MAHLYGTEQERQLLTLAGCPSPCTGDVSHPGSTGSRMTSRQDLHHGTQTNTPQHGTPTVVPDAVDDACVFEAKTASTETRFGTIRRRDIDRERQGPLLAVTGTYQQAAGAGACLPLFRASVQERRTRATSLTSICPLSRAGGRPRGCRDPGRVTRGGGAETTGDRRLEVKL